MIDADGAEELDDVASLVVELRAIESTTDRCAGAAFFDLDRTILRRPAVLAFYPALRDAKLVRRSEMLRALWLRTRYRYSALGERDAGRFRATLLQISAGWTAEAVTTAVVPATDRVVSRLSYRDARAAIEQHVAMGHLVAVLSSSPRELVAPVAGAVGAHCASGSQARADAMGRFTGELAFHCDGRGKLAVARALVDRYAIELRDCWAYSDSFSDLPLLEAVGHPVAVNPDRDLRDFAASRSWTTAHYE